MERNTKIRISGGITLAMMIFFLFVCGALMVMGENSTFSFYYIITMAFQLIGMGLACMFFIILFSDSSYNQGTQHFILLIIECYTMFLSSFISWYYDGDPGAFSVVAITNYTCYMLLISTLYTLWIFMLSIADRHSRLMHNMDRVATFAYLAGIILILGNICFHYYFYIDENAHFILTGTSYLSYVFPFVILALYTVAVAMFIRERRKKVAMYSFTVFVTIGCFFELTYFNVEILYLAVFFSLIIIYGNYYVGRSEDLVKKDAELVQQRAEILVSQIQPHFLYNALTSIMNIKGNPPETMDAISDFGKYLRANLDTLRQKGPIPIQMEIDHVETFMMLENLNLGDGLKLELAIRDRDFLIPSLMIQTLVERCVNSGYPSKDPVGTIRVETEETDISHVVTIEDDGNGESFVEDDEEFSLSSIERRIRDSVGGVVDVQSTVGIGTTITIVIPKSIKKTVYPRV